MHYIFTLYPPDIRIMVLPALFTSLLDGSPRHAALRDGSNFNFMPMMGAQQRTDSACKAVLGTNSGCLGMTPDDLNTNSVDQQHVR